MNEVNIMKEANRCNKIKVKRPCVLELRDRLLCYKATLKVCVGKKINVAIF